MKTGYGYKDWFVKVYLGTQQLESRIQNLVEVAHSTVHALLHHLNLLLLISGNRH
jgi:hypothetical protein